MRGPTGKDCQLEKRTGQDGKTRKLPDAQERRPAKESAPSPALTAPEREKIAAELATMMRGDADAQRDPQDCGSPKATVSEVSGQLGVATRTVEMAKEVKVKAPDLFDKIGKGLTTSRAHKEMMARERTKPTDPGRPMAQRLSWLRKLYPGMPN